jgi:hypothetical protein
MPPEARGPVISLMLAVPDAPTAAGWYKRALGATELWNLGSVVGLEVEGAPFFLAQPANNGWASPTEIGHDDRESRGLRRRPRHRRRTRHRGRRRRGEAPAGRLLRSVRAPLARRRQVSAESLSWVGAPRGWHQATCERSLGRDRHVARPGRCPLARPARPCPGRYRTLALSCSLARSIADTLMERAGVAPRSVRWPVPAVGGGRLRRFMQLVGGTR